MTPACLSSSSARPRWVSLASRTANAPGKVVVSGARAAVEASLEIARELGARKSVLLPVSVARAFAPHGGRGEVHGEVLDHIHFTDPSPALVSNAGAQTIRDAGAARAELVDHLTTGRGLGQRRQRDERGRGGYVHIEVGPGRVLTGLIKRIAPDALAAALDDPTAADGLGAAAVASAFDASGDTEERLIRAQA